MSTEHQELLIRRLQESGLSLTQFAERLMVRHHSAVRRWLQGRPIPRSVQRWLEHPPPPWPPKKR